MFEEISETKVSEMLKNENNFVIMLVNYEERSLAFLKKLRKAAPERLFLSVIELYPGGYSIETLEALKKKHLAAAKTLWEPFRKSFCRNKYPRPNKMKFREELGKQLSAFAEAAGSFNVIIDLSCLPKKIMYDAIDCIYTFSHNNPSYIKNVFANYTSPKKYPNLGFEQTIGVPHADMEGVSLADFLEKSLQQGRDIKAIFIPGFEPSPIITTFDLLESYQFSKMYVLLFFDGSNLWRGLRVMRVNQLFFHKTSQQSDKCYVDYCFSYLQGMNHIVEKAQRFMQENSSTIIFAPFGPKPFTLACFLTCKALKTKGIFADIVHISGLQYTSVYSIGESQFITIQLPSNVSKLLP